MKTPARACTLAFALQMTMTGNAVSQCSNCDVSAYLDGAGRTARVIFTRDSRGGWLSVNASRVSLRLFSLDAPELHATVRSSAAGWVVGTYRAFSNTEVADFRNDPVVELAFPIPDRVVGGMYRVLVDVPKDAMNDNAGESATYGNDVSPSLLYVPPADTLERLRPVWSRYLGRTMYPRPSDLLAHCWDGGDRGLAVNEPIGIVSIVPSGGQAERGRFMDSEPGFVALDPLIVTFLNDSSAAPTPASCASGDVVSADGWELERSFSSMSSAQVAAQWPYRWRAAWQQRTVVSGMTHEAVARVLGYPNEYGTIADFDALDRWDYNDSETRGLFSVTFDGDRVVRYDPPPRGP
jgi:hypothetical protein